MHTIFLSLLPLRRSTLHLILLLGLIVGNISSVRAQQLQPYLADTVSAGYRPAVIVCPGGSYSWHDMETEGQHVAEWLQAHGVHAFVLHYRVQGILAFWTHYRYIVRGHRYPDPLIDVQNALADVRSHAVQWHIDPNQVGVMGFSAGGHLACLAAELAKTPAETPDFVASIYPVVTFVQEPYVHKRSRRALLGERRKNDLALCDSLSLERHVKKGMAPVFLLNCKDDPVVHYHNSELLDSALTAEGVDHLYIQCETGGHGFGASDTKGSEETRGWLERFLGWMKEEPGWTR